MRCQGPQTLLVGVKLAELLWKTVWQSLLQHTGCPSNAKHEHTPNKHACICWTKASLVAQMVKNLPAMLETWVQSLGWEDPMEKEMAAHSSILAWKIPRTEEPGRLQSMGLQRVGHDWTTNTHTFLKKQQNIDWRQHHLLQMIIHFLCLKDEHTPSFPC